MAETSSFTPDWKIYLLLLFGFGILVSLFPFHTWAPQAYASAPSPAAMLHAGVLKKFGLYGLLRLAVPIFPNAVKELSPLLLTLLIGNILYVGYVTVSQKKLDWMLGYSSVMHMGYIFLGFAAMNVLSLTGAAVLLVAHGLTIAALFALSGELRERTGTLEFSELGGLARSMPAFGLLFGFAVMSGLGLPGFAGFAGELLVFFGAFGAGYGGTNGPVSYYWIATIIAVWGVVISAIYMLRAYRRIFFGPMADRWAGLPDLGSVPRGAVILLLVFLLMFGFFPFLLINYVKPALLWP